MSMKKTLSAIVLGSALMLGCKEPTQETLTTTPSPYTVAMAKQEQKAAEEEINIKTPCIDGLEVICVQENRLTWDSKLTKDGKSFLKRAGLNDEQILDVEKFNLQSIFPVDPLLSKTDEEVSKSNFQILVGSNVSSFLKNAINIANFLSGFSNTYSYYKDLSNRDVGHYALAAATAEVPISYMREISKTIKIQDRPIYGIIDIYGLTRNPDDVNCAKTDFLFEMIYSDFDVIDRIAQSRRLCQTRDYSDVFSNPEIAKFILDKMPAKEVNKLADIYAYLGPRGSSKIDVYDVIYLINSGVTADRLRKATEIIEEINNNDSDAKKIKKIAPYLK